MALAIDPFRLAIACVPLAAYALVLALVNARRRPLVVSGGSDLVTLGIALTGVAFVGPIELFRPEAATIELGNYIWIALLVFYGLCLLLVMLTARPRIVVYNISPDELHPALAETANRLDPEARWAGNHLSLPRLGVQLHLDSLDIMRNVSLAPSGGRQNLEGWRKLTRELSASLAGVRVKSNPRALGFLLAAASLLGISLNQMLQNPIELAQAFREVLAF
jgi:hypothetical protein